MSVSRRLRTRSPVKRLLDRLGTSYQTYINYHKTHAMATRYGGIGDNARNEIKGQNIEILDQNDGSQEDNEQLNEIDIPEPQQMPEFRQLTHQIEQLRQTIENNERDPLDAIHELEQRLNQLTFALRPSAEPIGNILDKYTDTLCMAQKKTQLENSLFQDIPTFNGTETSQLEEWITDIETASELTTESRTKLAQAKSRGLARTLISEALTSHKTWDEIKDILRLKICHSDIHTSISRFMDIKQRENESLAVYIHRFKCEANRCKFNNDAASIRIFVKGLQNAQTLATKVYEKGPQTLSEAIKTVEKLQAAHQLTSSLLPPSSVNTMSTNDDNCFQCKEPGHMARYCPHIRCFDCDNFGHVAADCPDKIPPSGTPSRHRGRTPSRHRNERSRSRTNLRDGYRHRSPSRSNRPNPRYQDHRDQYRQHMSRSHSRHNRYRSHSRHHSRRRHSRSHSRHSRRSTSHHRPSYSHHPRRDTPHRGQSNSRSFSRDPSHTRSHLSSKTRTPAKATRSNHRTETKQTSRKQVIIDDPPSEYYSSDETESDSEDDLN